MGKNRLKVKGTKKRNSNTTMPANSKPRMTIKDYLYCQDCQEYVDLWKYGDIESTGHSQCKWRYVTVKELAVCVNDCEDFGCFEGWEK